MVNGSIFIFFCLILVGLWRHAGGSDRRVAFVGKHPAGEDRRRNRAREAAAGKAAQRDGDVRTPGDE